MILGTPVGLVGSLRFCSELISRKPITTFQALSIDRLHWHLGLSFRDHDSQIAVTLGTGALEVLATELLNHVGDVNLGIHDFAEFAPVVCFRNSRTWSYTGHGVALTRPMMKVPHSDRPTSTSYATGAYAFKNGARITPVRSLSQVCCLILVL
jgi:hypothetical protein